MVITFRHLYAGRLPKKGKRKKSCLTANFLFDQIVIASSLSGHKFLCQRRGNTSIYIDLYTDIDIEPFLMVKKLFLFAISNPAVAMINIFK